MAVDPIATPPELPPRKKAGFSDKFSAWLTWFNGDFQTQFNAVIAYFNAAIAAFTNNATNATSTSALTIEAGIKNIVITAGKSWMKGQTARIAFDGSPAVWEQGTVRSYDPVTGAFEYVVEQTQGGGTSSALVISLAAAPTVLEKKGAAVASAATTNIWLGDGSVRHVTGAATINDFGTAPQAGMTQKLIFDGACPIVNSANLVLPGGNYVTEAGDQLEVLADTTTKMLVKISRVHGEVPAVVSSSGSNPSWDFLYLAIGNRLSPSSLVTVRVYKPVLVNDSLEPKLFSDMAAVQTDLATDLDTGSVSANQWYTLFLIGKKDGSQVFRWSLNKRKPALTGGYTHYLRLGFAYSINSSGHLKAMYKKNNSIVYQEPALVFDGSITAGVWTVVSLAAFVPNASNPDSFARSVRCIFGGTGLDMGLSGAENVGVLSGAAVSSGAVAGTASTFGSNLTSRTKYMSAEVPLCAFSSSASFIQYWSNTALGTLYVTGWEE